MTATSDQQTVPRAVLPAVLAAVLLALTFLGFRLVAHDGDPTHWVRAGEQYARSAELPDGFFQEQGLGYDGQFYYRLARAPLSTAERVDGIELDRPPFRHQRIGYPLAVWALSLGGQRALVPWALPAVNVLAVGVAAGAAAALVMRRGLPPWLGLAAGVVPGTVMALSLDLAEATEAALVLSALLLLDRRQPWGATAAMVGAVMTRETALVVPVAILVSLLATRVPLARRWRLAAERPIPVWAGVVPIGAYLLVQVAVSRAWPASGAGATRSVEHLNAPLEGLLDAFAHFSDYSPSEALALVLVLGIGCLGLACLFDRAAGAPHERLALLGATVLPLTLGNWARPVIYLRHPTIWVLLAVVICLSSTRRLRGVPVSRIACYAVVALAALAASMVGAVPDDDVRADGAASPVSPPPGARASGP